MISKKILIVPLLATCLLLIPVSRVSADLPPRPVPPSQNELENKGAKLILILPKDSQFTEDTWTRVEWQNAQGDWKLVDGWQGSPTFRVEQDYWEVEWWVGQENFSTGPYRWQVFHDQNSRKPLSTSKPFYLPSQQDSVLSVSIKD